MLCPLLTPREVACQARVTVRSLHNYWRAGNGPRRTCIGGRVFVREEDFLAWLDSCAEGAAAPALQHAEAA